MAHTVIGVPGAMIDADDRMLSNDDTGAPFDDLKDSAASGRTQFATIEMWPDNLTHADFFVVA